MGDLIGTCLWCSRDIRWDRIAGGWRHTEHGSLLCPDGSRAAVDNAASRTLFGLVRDMLGDSATARPGEH